MTKIAIIGYGFVGKAMEKGFSKKTNILLIDPLLNSTIEDLKNFDPEFIFVCLPTPMNSDGSQSNRIMVEVFDELNRINNKAIIILKSTLTPSSLMELEKRCERLVYNPEFLREKTYAEDFKNSPFIILGGTKKDNKEVMNLYENHSICKTLNFLEMDSKSASLIKYTINSFLASKVIFFNQIKDVFNSSSIEIDWDYFIDCISNDTRIGNSHMMVPGPDGKNGFGGACFPKDLSALINYAEEIGVDLSLLKNVKKINSKLRKKYEFDDREIEQNITYDN